MKKGLLLLFLLLAGCTTLPPADPSISVPQVPEGEVVVYIRDGCPYCAHTLDILADALIVPHLRNITTSRQAYQELLAIHRIHFPDQEPIVPVILTHQDILRGYNAQSLNELLAGEEISDRENHQSCP
ncbi:glutaredoxin family protein [Geoalkalibacter subterraneus]|uniref:glutaredoxin family protein n=1 Tax=Geoalkalibacter subterraneus TaxID=483547 RepID=UPI000693E9BE|nr:glutaredoxin domain-containing protein [Geoalkalibacter subterraneus]